MPGFSALNPEIQRPKKKTNKDKDKRHVLGFNFSPSQESLDLCSKQFGARRGDSMPGFSDLKPAIQRQKKREKRNAPWIQPPIRRNVHGVMSFSLFPKVFRFRVPNSWVRDEGNHARISGPEFRNPTPDEKIKEDKRNVPGFKVQRKRSWFNVVFLKNL